MFPATRFRFMACVVLTCSFLAACGGLSQDTKASERKTVLTTFTVIADIAQNVAGPLVHVEAIIKPGAEVHGYEPTPRDIAKGASADLVLENGLGLEAWFLKFIEQTEAPRVVLSRGIEPLAIGGGSAGNMPNPHAWMSPSNAQLYVDNIVVALSNLIPEHASDFAANGDRYKAEIQAIHEDFKEQIVEIPPAHRVLVSCEGAFSYLARDVGLSEKYLWAVNAEQQATPQSISSVINHVETNKVPAVFCESTVSDKAMQQVVAETGAHFGGTLYVDSLSTPDGPVPTYLDMLRHNSDLIVTGLKGNSR